MDDQPDSTTAPMAGPDTEGRGCSRGRSRGRGRGRGRGRDIVLVDLENLMAGSWADPAQLQAALDTVERVATAPGRRLTFAMSHHWFKAVGFDVKARFPGCRISPLESGPDGADESLIRAAREDRPEHGDTVVIVSGDGGFAPLAGELAGRGIDVTVVGWHHRTSRRLRLACTTFVAVEDIASRPVSPQAADAA